VILRWPARESACAIALAAACAGASAATPQQAPAPRAPATPRAAAPIDLTGQWVSVVSEDWRWRMLVPKKGDYASVPLNAEGRKAADAWDPARMDADGCRPYGAAGVMRVPGRIRVSWENDTTLKIETDAGLQTRRLRFGTAAPTPATRSWQGHSVAEWEQILQPGGLGVSLQTAPPRVGSLKVTTTLMRPGYLRRNGVPYSDAAVMTEYLDRVSQDGDEWLTVYTVLEDPRYLSQPFITSTHFKRDSVQAGWMPTPCEQRVD
jgi:hypothetical protein